MSPSRSARDIIGWRLFDGETIRGRKIAFFFTRLRSSSSFHALFFENSLAAGWLFATIVSALSLSLSCFLAELATLDSVQSRTHRVIDERAFDRRKKKSRCARGVIAKWPLITSVGAALPISSKNRVSFLSSSSSFFLSPNSVIYESANKR